jgi:hypothetical protein
MDADDMRIIVRSVSVVVAVADDEADEATEARERCRRAEASSGGVAGVGVM